MGAQQDRGLDFARVGFSQCAQSGSIGRQSEDTVSHCVSTLLPQAAERFARLVRSHWGGCESTNHRVRDALFEEDSTRSENLNLNGNLALLHCALIALKTRHAAHLSWPHRFEKSAANPSHHFKLVCNSAFK